MADDKVLKSIEERLTQLEASFKADLAARGGPVVDPAPWGGGSGWCFPRWPIPIPVDPSPWWSSGFGGFPSRPPIGPIGDPPPFDLSNLNLAQLELSLHTINAEKARLDSLENLVKNQIAKLKEQT